MSVKFFISYSHEDKNKMEALSRAINKAKKSYYTVIVAKKHAPGKPLSEKVKEGIIESDFIIPILTYNSINNQWVNQEIGYAIAVERKVFPIIEKSIKNSLKGFIHNQLDLPFSFESNKSNPRKEAASFRKCYRELISYFLNDIVEFSFNSRISPLKVKQGGEYKTKVKFKGRVRNGFFDNYVKHLESKWDTWNWDKQTLKNTGHTAAGELHGDVDLQSEYSWPTNNWPKGKYKIYVRIYDHLTPGVVGRIQLMEDVHDFEVM